MADICATYTYAGITINGPKDTDTLVTPTFNDIVGLDGKPIRRQIDPASQDNGDLDLQGAFFAGRVIVFSGSVHIGTLSGGTPATNKTEYIQKLVALQKAVVAALEAQLTSAATLAWTDATSAARSISCMYGLPGQEIKFGGDNIYEPTFSDFTLWAPDPDISG
jgi:hypothetical protein